MLCIKINGSPRQYCEQIEYRIEDRIQYFTMLLDKMPFEHIFRYEGKKGGI